MEIAGTRRTSDAYGAEPLVPSVSVGPALGLVVSSPILIWAGIGRHDVDTYYAFGPYSIDYGFEIAVLCLAVLLSSASLLSLLRGRRRTQAGALSAVSFLFLLATLCSGAAAWRVMTAGVGGANIGAGLLAMFGPWITAGFLTGAIAQQHKFRPMSRRKYAGLLAAAALQVPALFAFLLYLR